MGMMRRGKGWRSAVALTIGYALLLQVFFAYALASRAAADPSVFDGSFFSLCLTHDDAGDLTGTSAPTTSGAHCLTCIVSASATATLPDPVPLPQRTASVTAPAPFMSAAACLAYQQSRAGLSRAPPRAA
jgi:hypothetical protein